MSYYVSLFDQIRRNAQACDGAVQCASLLRAQCRRVRYGAGIAMAVAWRQARRQERGIPEKEWRQTCPQCDTVSRLIGAIAKGPVLP